MKEIDDATKPLAEMSDAELLQMIERYHQKMEPDKRRIGTSAYALSAIVYQNELILRAIKRER